MFLCTLQGEKDALLAKLPTPTPSPALSRTSRARKNRKKKADMAASHLHEKVTLAFELPVTHVNMLAAEYSEVRHRQHFDACMVRCDKYVRM